MSQNPDSGAAPDWSVRPESGAEYCHQGRVDGCRRAQSHCCLRALETDANANILSTPTLLTLDNEEAQIVIGRTSRSSPAQYAQTGAATTPTPFQTIERKDVGLTLRIKPQISEGGAVRLQISRKCPASSERRCPTRRARSPTSARSNPRCWSTTARSW